NGGVVLWADKHRAVLQAAEMFLLQQRRFADVIVGCDAVVTGQLGQLPDVFQIIAANVDIEENRVSVLVLLAHQVIKILADGNHRLGQSGLDVPGIDGQVDGGHAGVRQTVDQIRLHQPSVGGDINPEAFFGGVVDDLLG